MHVRQVSKEGKKKITKAKSKKKQKNPKTQKEQNKKPPKKVKYMGFCLLLCLTSMKQ
jgi:hypothetical protein